MAGHFLNCAKRVFGIPDFKHYALGDGLSNIFSRFPVPLIGDSSKSEHLIPGLSEHTIP